MGMITYRRSFKFSAAHFNSRKTYETYWGLVEMANDEKNREDTERDFPAPKTKDLMDAFLDIHGHNFVVDIEAAGEPNEEGWIVDDIEIAEMIKQWDGVNLSVLPTFVRNRERATTENMAMKIKQALEEHYPNPFFSVRVHETEDVYAEAA